MRTIAIVTTFNEKGYHSYGKIMIESFIKYWPKDVTLYVYVEDFTPPITSDNIRYVDLNRTPIVAFKQRHQNNPLAHGDKLIKVDSKGKRIGIGFRWDAVRFAHKVYAITDCSRCDSDLLFWVDADTRTFDYIPKEFLESLLPESNYCCYLGRKNKYSECGFVGYNLRHHINGFFMPKFQNMYDNDEVFSLKEWHDSFVFDHVRLLSEAIGAINVNLSANMEIKEGHPFINSPLGKYMDHLKGDRKILGKSKQSDLIIKRNESYWQ